MKMTTLQFIIGQARVFATEHQGNFSPLTRLFDHFLPAFARIQQRPGNATIAGTGAQHQIAAHQRIFQGGNDLGIFENVTGSRRTRIRFVMRKQPRLNQHQPRQPHVFHGTRSPTDVPGMTGIDQNDTNIRQQRSAHRPVKGSKSYLSKTA